VQGISISDIPQNFVDGGKCWMLGENSQPDDDCAKSLQYVSTYMLFNVAYNILLVLILKFGSATLMFVASAVVIPLANICFTFKFIMGDYATPLRVTDIVGLVVILLGLGLYRSVRGGGDEAEKGEGDAMLPGFGPAGAELVRPLRVKKPVLLEARSVRQIRSTFYTRIGISPGQIATNNPSSYQRSEAYGTTGMPNSGSTQSLNAVV
jgi:hypothetical protein